MLQNPINSIGKYRSTREDRNTLKPSHSLAEHKRRTNIKVSVVSMIVTDGNWAVIKPTDLAVVYKVLVLLSFQSGFDTLHQLVPALAANPNAKISKAATLLKGAEYCRWLKEDRAKMQEEAEALKAQIDRLNNDIR